MAVPICFRFKSKLGMRNHAQWFVILAPMHIVLTKRCLIPWKQSVTGLSHTEYVQSVFIGRAVICSTNFLRDVSRHSHIEWNMHTDQPYSPSHLIQLSPAYLYSIINYCYSSGKYFHTWDVMFFYRPSTSPLYYCTSFRKWLNDGWCTLHSLETCEKCLLCVTIDFFFYYYYYYYLIFFACILSNLPLTILLFYLMIEKSHPYHRVYRWVGLVSPAH